MSNYRKRTITIFDVARASGVSFSTGSRVFSGFAFVKESTRQRVLEMGHLAVNLLLEQINHPETTPKQVTLETSLIIRDSCQHILKLT
jgi:DNA-binding LacI/PurR family transcriptional regulator